MSQGAKAKIAVYTFCCNSKEKHMVNFITKKVIRRMHAGCCNNANPQNRRLYFHSIWKEAQMAGNNFKLIG